MHELPKEPVEASPTPLTRRFLGMAARASSGSLYLEVHLSRHGCSTIFPLRPPHLVGYLSLGDIFEVAEVRTFRDSGVFLRLANPQGSVFSRSQSGTFCVQVDESWRQYSIVGASTSLCTWHYMAQWSAMFLASCDASSSPGAVIVPTTWRASAMEMVREFLHRAGLLPSREHDDGQDSKMAPKAWRC
ncbi:unnamed protein product [Symbiodinium sp. CCMP2592]|nr:unnamed protein product [Symbiodinium sp. CCMP2592]